MKILCKTSLMIFTFIAIFLFLIIISNTLKAGSYNGQDLALAILKNDSTLISSSYIDNDLSGHRQAGVFTSLGTMTPTHNNSFVFFSTGIAGNNPITTDEENPGDERGTWFRNQRGNPRDFATLTMHLLVPDFMHYLYYDVQFFSAEYPEFIGTKYNDKLTITVNSPSQGISQYVFDVNSGYFVLNSNGIPGTGFDIFARSGRPADVDLVDTTPRNPGADAGASDLIPIGGATHPVSPGEEIIVTINIQDVGDNMFDSGAFIDNLRFSGFAKADIIAKKDVEDINHGDLVCNDTLRYTITISNTGTANQNNNPGDEFVDFIPQNTTYVNNSAYSQYGTISYNSVDKKITWNGNIPKETSRTLEFQVKVNNGLPNGAEISNQGTVYWDTNGDGSNDATELTDDMHKDDGIDQDGDGETDDDDPTIVYVYGFDYPAEVTEDFSDDIAGQNASQAYLSRNWFNTVLNDLTSSSFEVAEYYHYSTLKSFKTKLRLQDSPQYWYYTLSNLENAEMIWWEIWFTCGDTSEDYDLYISLQDDNSQNIAKIKFDYVNNGTKPMDWLLELFYWDTTQGWCKLNSDFNGGYLRNSWYKIRIEKNGDNLINYSLSRVRRGVIDSAVAGQLSGSFSDFERVEWISTKNPTVCPIFFWDEHKIGLSYED